MHILIDLFSHLLLLSNRHPSPQPRHDSPDTSDPSFLPPLQLSRPHPLSQQRGGGRPPRIAVVLLLVGSGGRGAGRGGGGGRGGGRGGREEGFALAVDAGRKGRKGGREEGRWGEWKEGWLRIQLLMHVRMLLQGSKFSQPSLPLSLPPSNPPSLLSLPPRAQINISSNEEDLLQISASVVVDRLVVKVRRKGGREGRREGGRKHSTTGRKEV